MRLARGKDVFNPQAFAPNRDRPSNLILAILSPTSHKDHSLGMKDRLYLFLPAVDVVVIQGIWGGCYLTLPGICTSPAGLFNQEASGIPTILMIGAAARNNQQALLPLLADRVGAWQYSSTLFFAFGRCPRQKSWTSKPLRQRTSTTKANCFTASSANVFDHRRSPFLILQQLRLNKEHLYRELLHSCFQPHPQQTTGCQTKAASSEQLCLLPT